MLKSKVLSSVQTQIFSFARGKAEFRLLRLRLELLQPHLLSPAAARLPESRASRGYCALTPNASFGLTGAQACLLYSKLFFEAEEGMSGPGPASCALETIRVPNIKEIEHV